MAVPTCAVPPDARTNYILDQFEGERITLPGSKGVFRILASSKQTNGSMAIFTSGSVIADAPGFHWHNEAHDVFLVTKGFLKLWGGDKCRILGPGDFAYVPPKVIHNPEPLGPHTELFGLVAPGDWVDFFRYVGETYNGVLVPEHDGRDLRAHLREKMMAAKDRFDVHFSRDYQPPAVGEWLPEEENMLAAPGEPYFLRANTGPRWVLGGVVSRPFIRAAQTSNKFAISSIESSKAYAETPLARWLTFATVDHCFVVQEGLFGVRIKGGEWNDVREGQTIVVAAGETFMVRFSSMFVRVWSCTNGAGIEEVIHRAGSEQLGYVIPDAATAWDEERIGQVCEEIGATSVL